MSRLSTAASDSRFSLDRPRLPPPDQSTEYGVHSAKCPAPGSCSESSKSTMEATNDCGNRRLLGGGRLGQETEQNAGKRPSHAATIR